MWALAVVIESPSFDLTSRITQTREPVGVQALVWQSAVEAFRVGILQRLSGLN